MTKISSLFFNHFDAWVATLAITVLCIMNHHLSTSLMISWACALTLLAWLGFALNDFFDAETDRLDKIKEKRNFFADRNIPQGLQRVGKAAMAIAALTVFILVVPYFNIFAILVSLAAVLASFTYSRPPIRLKSRPILDVLTHACLVETGPYLATILVFKLNITIQDVGIIMTLFLASLAAQIEQQIRDFLVDKANNETNTVQLWGQENSHRFLKQVTVLVIIVNLLFTLFKLYQQEVIVYAVLAGIYYFHRLYRMNQRLNSVERPEILIKILIAVAFLYTITLILHSIGYGV